MIVLSFWGMWLVFALIAAVVAYVTTPIPSGVVEPPQAPTATLRASEFRVGIAPTYIKTLRNARRSADFADWLDSRREERIAERIESERVGAMVAEAAGAALHYVDARRARNDARRALLSAKTATRIGSLESAALFANQADRAFYRTIDLRLSAPTLPTLPTFAPEA